MITEIASTMRQICQEIRAKELFDDFWATVYSNRYYSWTKKVHGEKPHGHTLGSIRRFKGF